MNFENVILSDVSFDRVQAKFEGTKGVIRNRKSKDGQCNGPIKKDKRTNNDLQNINDLYQ